MDEDNLVASYEWIRDLLQDTPEGLSTSEEEIFIHFTLSENLKRKFCNKSVFEFWYPGERKFYVKAATPKCLGGPPVDRDRLNGYPGSKFEFIAVVAEWSLDSRTESREFDSGATEDSPCRGDGAC
ncbi:hypothetical protein TNCV_3385401 [Trichonephila clavipes]|uniref:Uncharacterized protein n=1 Tax=Trichonephila clavipes TaxID=2585209 RepID=A0A8X6VLU8_TRICX|nr:hypothetical protein TNCV_3385401 [Trichonephila clavipes]